MTKLLSSGADKFGTAFPATDGPFATMLRWIERPADAGFRFVGFADEVAPRRVEHTGWWTDPDGDNGQTLRGAVYQIPARGGRAIYVAGYQEIGFGEEGAAALALDELFYGDEREDDRGGRYSDWADGARDAASRADQLAEQVAEREREYQESWRAGSNWQEAGDEISEARKEALEILVERRVVVLPAAMCGAIRDKVESLLETIQAARDKRRELASGYWQADAFNEAAGCVVI